MKKRNGFTLIELLAVIVILGVIMIIAIPSVTSYITNSRKDTTIDTAKSFISAVKTAAVANSMSVGSTIEYALPTQVGGTTVVSIKHIELEKGGDKSAFGNDWDYSKSYVVVKNEGTTAEPEYVYYVALLDKKGNGLSLTEESQLKRSVVATPTDITAVTQTTAEAATTANLVITGVATTPATAYEYVLGAS